MGNTIKLTVILPVFNGMPYLQEAIKSVMEQTFQDFILHIVENGSTDGTKKFLKQIKNDKIKITNLKEKGLVNALNTGLKLSTTPFVARMDADDLIHKNKFQKQINFLEHYENVGLVGTMGKYVSENESKTLNIYVPTTHEKIINKMLENAYALIHPSIMMRRNIFEFSGFYNENYYPCEEFELILRIGNNTKLANIPEFLHYLRIRKGSITDTQFGESMKLYQQLSMNYREIYNYSTNTKPSEFLNWVDLISLKIYRRGLNYYLNKNVLIGFFYFALSGIINPIRLLKAVVKRV